MSSTSMQTFDLEALQSTHAADIKSACISLIIGPRGLACEANL